MTSQLLYYTQSSELTDIVLWVILGLALVLLSYLLYWQRQQGKELAAELKQLGSVKKNNVEYEFVLKSMRLSAWHIDSDTKAIVFDNDFRDKNDTYVPTEGQTTDDLAKVIPEEDRKRFLHAVDDLLSGRMEETHVEYRVKQPNTGKTYWSESYAIVADRNADGSPKRIVGTSLRIDDRKNMEQALIEARNRAEESDRLKSAFLANMSHEIRTPLNAIVGFTSVLPDVTDPEERKMLLGLVQENTQKLLVIIDDVVNISKVEAGKEELSLSSFDLCTVLQDLVGQHQGQQKEGVSLTTQFACAPQNITTDRNRLLEIMKHLISNALKFTRQGNIIVGFDAPVEDRIRIFVCDTGIGIAKEFHERIFERFFKVDEFVPGAGLGLSICRTMAYSLGGSVSVESQLGQGSIFTLELPVS